MFYTINRKYISNTLYVQRKLKSSIIFKIIFFKMLKSLKIIYLLIFLEKLIQTNKRAFKLNQNW